MPQAPRTEKEIQDCLMQPSLACKVQSRLEWRQDLTGPVSSLCLGPHLQPQCWISNGSISPTSFSLLPPGLLLYKDCFNKRIEQISDNREDAEDTHWEFCARLADLKEIAALFLWHFYSSPLCFRLLSKPLKGGKGIFLTHHNLKRLVSLHLHWKVLLTHRSQLRVPKGLPHAPWNSFAAVLICWFNQGCGCLLPRL